MNYKDLGYNSFGIRTILPSRRESPIRARNLVGIGALSSVAISSPLNATTDIVFSSTDNDTAAWTAGTIYFADGSSSGQVAAGNTGNILATTYVYFDKDKPGELKTTTKPEEATGPLKFMIAIVEAGAAGKNCKITPTIAAGLIVSGITAEQIAAGTIVVGNINSAVTNRLFTDSTTKTNVEGWKHASDVTKIDGGDIYTNSITATQIAAGTITATEISGDQLDVVATKTGTLNVDEYITVGITNIKIDGTNKRIIVNDGTYDRILIGYQASGF